MKTSEKGPVEQEQRAVAVASSGAASRQTLRNIALIIGREYKNRVTQRVFIITSIILLVIVFLVPFIPTIVQLVQHITARSGSQTQVVVGLGALLLQAPLQAALFGTNAGGLALFFTGVFLPFYLLFLLYFLLAFFLYAALFAGLGAMVKRQDEVTSATQVPLMLIILAWIPVIFGFSSPDATWMKVLSYFPFWTPMLMLVRIGRSTVDWWEIVTTAALMLVAISACTWFAARLYRLGVLMYGQRPGLRRLLKMVRMS